MGILSTELRIGNFVKTTNDIYTISGIDEDSEDAILSNFLGAKIKPTQLHDIKPIPLTEDWLLKFGFKWYDAKTGKRFVKKWFDDGDEFWLEIELSGKLNRTFCWLNWDIGGGRNFVHIPHKSIPENVHDLQNLFFALTGQELELKS